MSLFELDSPKLQIPKGIVKSIHDMDTFIRPALNKAGFNIEYLRGSEVYVQHKLSEYQNWSRFVQRFLPKGSGLLTKIYSLDNPDQFIIAQAFYIPTVTPTALADKPRLSIPTDIIRKTTPATRVAYVLGACEAMDIHYLILTPGMFAFARFTDVPLEGWSLTWRTNPDKLDRMHIKAEYQTKMFSPISMLSTELKGKPNN